MPFTNQRKHALLRFGALLLTLAVSGLIPPQTGAQEQKKDVRILFVSDRETPDEYAIYAMNPDGSGQTRISKGKGVAFDPAWSSDHKQILYSFIANKEVHKSDLMVMKADGSEPARLIAGEEKTVIIAPSWSPDGKRILYNAVQTGNAMPEATIYIVDADGKNRKKLGNGILPSWSQDGKRIFFSPMLDASGPPALKSMDTEGANVKTLTDKGVGPSFSPDGKRVVFTAGENHPDVFIMDVDGTHVTQLTKDPGNMGVGPVWTSDGKHILFTRILDNGGKPKVQICQMDPDGSNVKALTKEDSFVGAGPSLFLLVFAAGM